MQGFINDFQMIDWTVKARDFEVTGWNTQEGLSFTCKELIMSNLQN